PVRADGDPAFMADDRELSSDRSLAWLCLSPAGIWGSGADRRDRGAGACSGFPADSRLSGGRGDQCRAHAIFADALGCRLWLVPVRRAPGWSHNPGGGSDHCLWALHPDARASGRFTSASGNACAFWQRDGDRPALEPVAAPDARTWLISGTRRFL